MRPHQSRLMTHAFTSAAAACVIRRGVAQLVEQRVLIPLAGRSSRLAPATFISPLAQLVERRPYKTRVGGSRPSGTTTSTAAWRNWQTREIESLVPIRACGFDPHGGHHFNGDHHLVDPD